MGGAAGLRPAARTEHYFARPWAVPKGVESLNPGIILNTEHSILPFLTPGFTPEH